MAKIKIGLSKEDKNKMSTDIYDKVNGNLKIEVEKQNKEITNFKNETNKNLEQAFTQQTDLIEDHLRIVDNRVNQQDETIAGLGQLRPSGTDTSENIQSKTSDDGIWIATDNGNWYYWDASVSGYVSGGIYQASQGEITHTYSVFVEINESITTDFDWIISEDKLKNSIVMLNYKNYIDNQEYLSFCNIEGAVVAFENGNYMVVFDCDEENVTIHAKNYATKNTTGSLINLTTENKENLVSAINEVNSKQNVLQPQEPKETYENLSALQSAYPNGASGVYVCSDNGHWYYWDGSAWTDGGIYQTTQGNIVHYGNKGNGNDIIKTLHPENNQEDNLYPNIKAENIPNKAINYDKLDDNLQLTTDKINGKKHSISTYYDELGLPIGGNIYKSNRINILSNSFVKNIKFYANNVSTSFILFLLDVNDTIIDKFEISNYNEGWNTLTINREYNVELFVAISGGNTRFSYSTLEKDNYYSDGLFECASSYRNSNIGDTLTFTQNVPGRFYEISIEINYDNYGLIELFDKINSTYNLYDFPMLKTYRTNDNGYTLVGRWYSFSTFNECCNCGGQSILFNVKGSSSVSIDIKELIHPSNPEWKMAVAPYIAYSIDGSSFIREQIGENPIVLTIPDNQIHLVWIVIDGLCLNSGSANRNSGWSGVYINSITTDGQMFKVDVQSRKILFVGDSIVEGINVLGTTSTSESNSSVNEFSYKTALKLNALPVLQGYGGSTSWNGVNYEKYSIVDSHQDTFIVYNNIDIILIEYGYNDYSAIISGTKTIQDFINSYNELINLLRNKYSGIPIFCLIPFKQSLATQIRNIANSKSYCYVIETSDYDVTYSDNAHPNVNGAEEISKRLTEDILKILSKDYFIR